MRLDFDGERDSGGSRSGTVNGVMVATVTDNKDPDALGRVKLKFPLRENEHETDWVPIASLMSGNNMGTLFIPEVGDEVLVAFHLGYLNQPYVIGCLWNQSKKPPAKDDQNNLRKIRSRAGHELIFDDTNNAGKVTLKTVKGIQMIIDDQNEKITIGTKNDQQSVTLTGSSAGTVEIKSGTNKITIDNKGDIKIESTKGVTIKSTQLNIEATANMTIKAGAQLNLESSGILNVKGSLVKIN
ncbi:phage baseplate assembly protein V [Cohnella caldifontis]|uniref:phage baseplate assembly protein V n=1 Tax=Cohnella caldifontis TaxID=3027471 RepID=UPI0023EB8D09|nr:phage baseplate assembly protein V [Cohnella sp. YIM B05605]